MMPDNVDPLGLNSATGQRMLRDYCERRKVRKRKPHNGDSGYIAERIFKPTGSHIVIYIAAEQDIDVAPHKYAVVCSKHATICGETSVPRARVLMKYPEFCEACMDKSGDT